MRKVLLMNIMRGSRALSDFRVKKLIASFEEAGIRVSSLSTHYVHLCDVSEELTEQELSVLAKLLTYGPRDEGGSDESNSS